MKAVVQRVSHGSVSVSGKILGEIGQGLVILLGIGPQDNEAKAVALAKKIALLRIFGDSLGKMNLSCLDIQGSALVVSQFTLYADTRKGNRPAFTDAASPDLARPLCRHFAEQLSALGIPTQTGEFGAMMTVEIINDGPVTIILEL
jgi:D-aminoacyl-tRNA deacylase